MTRPPYKLSMARIAAILQIVDFDPSSLPRTRDGFVLRAIAKIADDALGHPSYADMNEILGDDWRSKDWREIADAKLVHKGSK